MDSKKEREQLGERINEINQELLSLKDQATEAEAQQRSVPEDFTERWDALTNEKDTCQKRADVLARLSSFEDVKKPSITNYPTTGKGYSAKKVVTRSDCNKALKAYYSKGKPCWNEDYADAADRAGFNFRSDSFNIKLRSSEEIHERAQSVGTTTEGGYSVNGVMVEGFEKALKSFWSWQDLVTIHRTDGDGDLGILTLNDTSNQAAYVAELTAATNTSLAFDRKVLKAYKLFSGIFPISNELIADSSQDIMGIVSAALGERLARKISAEVTNGTGVGDSHLTGFAAATSLGATSFFFDGLSYFDFVDLYTSVNEAYRNNPKCAWMMSSAVYGQVLSLVDLQGRPILGPGLNGSPVYSLLGKPIVVNDNLPTTLEAGAKSVYFGDWSKVNVRIVRDVTYSVSNELYWKEEAVAAKASMRIDSMYIDASGGAIKHLKMNDASGAPSIDD